MEQLPSQSVGERKFSLGIPAAIIVAGLIVAGAIIYVGQDGNGDAVAMRDVADERSGALASAIELRPFNGEDHIRGSAQAPVKIIEFSDTECPFCKRFHVTMQQVMTEFGASGKVAWIYRHFPLDQIHPKARAEAAATECAAELGGNDAFWKYLDRIFEITPSNNGLDLAELPRIAQYIGLEKGAFQECLASERYDEQVQADYDDALRAGAEGTPYTVVVDAKGKTYVINGAQPYSSVKQVIETALKGK